VLEFLHGEVLEAGDRGIDLGAVGGAGLGIGDAVGLMGCAFAGDLGEQVVELRGGAGEPRGLPVSVGRSWVVTVVKPRDSS